MNVLIVDDETPAREEIARLLSRVPDVNIVGQCANAVEALSAINHLHPDVVFLDINMPQISGLELLGMLDPDEMPRVVFLTAYSEYALKAFEQDAYDYLLKPVDPARLDVTLQRLRRDSAPVADLAKLATPLRQIPCPGHQRVQLVKVEQVEYVNSTGTGVFLVTTDGVEHFTELTLRTLEERTPLLRCHRQYLVNPEQILEIVFQELGGAEIVTHGGRHVPVSRRLLGELKEKLGFA
jgi:two-component system LytT family response regulator